MQVSGLNIFIIVNMLYLSTVIEFVIDARVPFKRIHGNQL